MHLEKQRTALGERDVVALLFVRGACLSHLSLGVTNRTHTHTPTRARNPRVRMSTARPLSYNANVRMQRQLDANAPSPLLFSLSPPSLSIQLSVSTLSATRWSGSRAEIDTNTASLLSLLAHTFFNRTHARAQAGTASAGKADLVPCAEEARAGKRPRNLPLQCIRIKSEGCQQVCPRMA